MKRIDLITSHKEFLRIIAKLEEVEQDREFCHHGLEHLLNVARIMMIKNLDENRGFDKEIIYAVALLHDIGKLQQYQTKVKHAEYGSVLAPAILKDCQFDEEQISQIALAIKTHSHRQPTNPLGELLYTADKLSRNCFACPAKDKCNWDETKKNRGITI